MERLDDHEHQDQEATRRGKTEEGFGTGVDLRRPERSLSLWLRQEGQTLLPEEDRALEDMPPALREQVVAAKILGHFGERQPVTAAVAAKFAAVNAAAGTAAAATDSLAQAIVAASLTGETGSNDMRGEGTSGHQGRAEPVVEPPGPCGSYDFSGSDGVQGR